MNKKKTVLALVSAGVLCGVLAGDLVYVTNKHNEEVLKLQSSIDESNTKIFELSETNQELQDQITSLTSELGDMTQSRDTLKEEITQMYSQVTYNPWNVLEPSGATPYHIKKSLMGTKLYELSDDFYEVEQTTGINAYFFIGLVAQESAWGTSKRSHYQNNLTGYKVYSSVSRGAYFQSKSHNIEASAELLKEEYLTEGGLYYTSNPSIWSINSKYCLTEDQSSADYKWSSNINSIANSLIEKANTTN